jgi:acetyl esterase/lipase
MGESAGGQLALLVGSTAKVTALNKHGLYTDQSNEVACIVDLYGIPDLAASTPRDLSLIFAESTVAIGFAGATEADTADNIRTASPVTYIDAKTAPILILHGSADSMVPVSMSRRLASRLKQLGAPYEYIEIPGANHGFDLQPKQMDLRPAVLDFLKKYLGNPGVSGPSAPAERSRAGAHLFLEDAGKVVAVCKARRPGDFVDGGR